jgi:hypothetical protein
VVGVVVHLVEAVHILQDGLEVLEVVVAILLQLEQQQIKFLRYMEQFMVMLVVMVVEMKVAVVVEPAVQVQLV